MKWILVQRTVVIHPHPLPKRPTHMSLCSVEDESYMKSYHYFRWLGLATISQGTADSWGRSLTVEVSQVLFTYCSLSNCLYQHRFFSQPCSYTYTHPHTCIYMHTYIHAHTFTSVLLIHPFSVNQSRTGSFFWDHLACQLRVVECKPSSPPPGSSAITAIWVTLNVKRSPKCLSESTGWQGVDWQGSSIILAGISICCYAHSAHVIASLI